MNLLWIIFYFLLSSEPVISCNQCYGPTRPTDCNKVKCDDGSSCTWANGGCKPAAAQAHAEYADLFERDDYIDGMNEIAGNMLNDVCSVCDIAIITDNMYIRFVS